MTKRVLPLEELGQALTNSGLGADLRYGQWKMDKLLGRQMDGDGKLLWGVCRYEHVYKGEKM